MNDTCFDVERLGNCQAAVFLGSGRPFELRPFDLPIPGAGEALVRVECCTICGSDLHTISGVRTEPTPSILGHEVIGVIDSVGDPAPSDINQNPLHPGERITWSTSVSCGNCNRCLSGLPQKCRTLAKYGHELAQGRYALSGGLAEYLLVRRGSTMVRIAHDLLAKVICPVSCATATIVAAYRTAGSIAGRRIMILGAGMLGLTAIAFARSHNAAIVVACDVNLQRLQRATSFGADCGVKWDPDTDSLRRQIRDQCKVDSFDLVLELSGSPEAVEMAIRFGDIGGQIVLVGSVMKSRPAQIDPEYVVRRWLSIHGVHNYCPSDLQTAVGFLERCGLAFPFADLIESTYRLSELNTAVEIALRNRPIRIAVCPK